MQKLQTALPLESRQILYLITPMNNSAQLLCLISVGNTLYVLPFNFTRRPVRAFPTLNNARGRGSAAGKPPRVRQSALCQN